jgi:hypothetical protein
MHPAGTKARSPADFASLLNTSEPSLLVGGQAVNLWALYYRDRTADLAPFVSRDADILGDKETLVELGRVVGVKPRFFPISPPTNEVGVVIAKDSDGSPLLIEVLRYVNGVTNDELREPTYPLDIGKDQVRVQIPGPIALLKAKIANLVTINQTDRQDARHVLILCRVLPAYLLDLESAAISGTLSERKLIEFLEQLVAIVTDREAVKILANLKISRLSIFSLLKGESLRKLRNFLEERLPRAIRE